MLDNCTDSAHDLTTVLQTILTHVIWWKDNSQEALLFSVDLSDAPDEQLSLNINLMKLISFSLDCGGGKLSSDHWDFILCSLASWIQVQLLVLHVLFFIRNLSIRNNEAEIRQKLKNI